MVNKIIDKIRNIVEKIQDIYEFVFNGFMFEEIKKYIKDKLINTKDKSIDFIKKNAVTLWDIIKERLNSKEYKHKFKFSMPKEIYHKDKSFNPHYIPKLNSYVVDNLNRRHKLVKQIGRTGGEGSVYLTDTGYACKIYKKEKNTLFKKKKIELLINNNIKVKNVALPELMAFNKNREFIGYLMPKVEGTELKTSIFIPELFKKKFPYWNRLHLVKVALNILKSVKELHSYNIILGDINPSNILVKNENEVYFIDTDSFQIEGYPCPVGMASYTKPLYHKKRYDSYLRTKDDDIFALVILIFQILMVGKHPYAFKGGGKITENMIDSTNFPYECGKDEDTNNIPEGYWNDIWNNLPKRLRKLFCKFLKDRRSITINEFIKILEKYEIDLSYYNKKLKVFP